MEMQIEFELPFEIEKENGWYIASCPILDVFSQGKTEKEAEKNLNEALVLFLISCFERGTIDEILKECGFEPVYETTPTKMRKTIKHLDVRIPFNIKQTKVGCHV